jgi:hypothetical protein
MRVVRVPALELALLLSLSVSACEKREPHDPLKVDPASTPAPAKTNKPLAELFSAKAPTFPAVFNGVTPGMTLEEAKKKIPGLDKEMDFQLPEYDTRAGLRVSDEKRVRYLTLSAGKDALPLATAAWGKPTVVKISGDDWNVWFNPEAKVRAKLRSSEYSRVEFASYVPVAEFLGSDKGGPAFQKAHPLIGMTADDVRKNYAANVLEASAEKNAAQMAAIQKFAGTKADLGASQASIDLIYPPTEYGSDQTKVYLNFQKGKLYRYMFDVGYEGSAQQKDDVLALTTKTYGKPKPKKDFSTTYLVFRKSPTVKLEDKSGFLKAWSFIVEK